MSGAKHTPGSIVWDDERGCSVMLTGELRIAVDALPDLLEALQGMLEVYGITAADYERHGVGSRTEVALCDQARAAICKAMGEDA